MVALTVVKMANLTAGLMVVWMVEKMVSDMVAMTAGKMVELTD